MIFPHWEHLRVMILSTLVARDNCIPEHTDDAYFQVIARSAKHRFLLLNSLLRGHLGALFDGC